MRGAALLGLAASLLASTPAQAQRVDARTLGEAAPDYLDRTVELDDHFACVSKRTTRGERELGFAPDTHLKIHLQDSRMVAFIPRTPERDQAFRAMPEGTPLRLKGVVRIERIPRPDQELMGSDEVDLIIMFADERVALLDVKELGVGNRLGPWASRPAQKPVYESVRAAELAKAVNKDVRVDLPVVPFTFSREFSEPDRAVGHDPVNTVKILGLVEGVVVYVQRTPQHERLLLSMQKGDVLRVKGHVVPPAVPGAPVVLRADRVR